MASGCGMEYQLFEDHSLIGYGNHLSLHSRQFKNREGHPQLSADYHLLGIMIMMGAQLAIMVFSGALKKSN